ncbi:methyltransferase domain-containing protein [Lutimonas sp.]|uniref:methyltransferase domain-containing protein n=1 Tax=Lutimonas sp. TaxID=1872403 RepID=UPI003D9B1C9E
MKLFKLALNTIPRPYLIKMSYLATPFLSVWLKGDTYTDPIDGKSFKRFLPYGYGEQRPNVLSPSTLSLERHRLMWLYLKNDSSFFDKPLKVLHMAPEQCFLSRFKKMKNLDYTTADLYSPIVDVKADILELPFEDNLFDVVFCNHVLEHIEDDHKAMSELYRVMKPGGMGIFQVPQELSRKTTYEDPSITTPDEKAKHFGQYDHVRVYGQDYFNRLRKVGFEVEEVDYSKKLSPNLIEKYRLATGEILPVCFK